MSSLMLYDAATVISQLLRGAPDGKDYRIANMYVEFENNGGAAVTPPALVDRSEGLEYYNGLSVSLTRDYLRVPIVRTSLESSNPTLYPAGNAGYYDVHLVGGPSVVGVHGKVFQAGNQSRVYGGALVASPEPDDPAADLVVYRFYYDTAAQQLILPASAGIAVEASLTIS